MIRRDVTADDGSAAWMLISQLAHARLSADLAAAWDAPRRPLIEPRSAFVETVRRHDDGWLVWEQRPEVHDGRPRDFMEMPVDESLAIWRRSIAVAAVISPASSVIVGGHFRALLERGVAKHESLDDWSENVEHLAHEFIAEQDDARRDFLATQPPERRGDEEARLDRGLHYLQWFDFASLWLCCAARTEPQSMPCPDDPAIRFVPQGDGTIVVNPWPFSAAPLELSVAGRVVPAVAYRSTESLAAAPSAATEIVFRLRPE